MNSPQPTTPGAHGNPRDSFFSKHSGFTESFEHMNLGNHAARPASTHTMSSISVSGKDYLALSFKRVPGNDWDEAIISELPAAQNELKKVVKKKEGNTLPQLETMAGKRRNQIQELAADLSSQEVGDVFWEPVVIKNTDEKTSRDGKLTVKAFKVIFARRVRKPDPAPKPAPTQRRPSRSSEKPKVKQAAPPKPKAEPAKEKPKSEEKPKTYTRVAALNDAFGATQLFSPHGEPMDKRGPIPYENAGLPAYISAERPIGHKPPPKEQPKIEHGKGDPLLQPGVGGLGDLKDLFNARVEPGQIDGIIELPPDDNPLMPGRFARQPIRRESRSRRRSSALRDGDKQFRNSARFSDIYPSSTSSWASEESAIQGEWDDLSSRTSEEAYSPPRSPRYKTRRKYITNKAYDTSRSRRGDQMYIEDSRRSKTIGDRRNSIGFDQSRTRRRSPLIHQSTRPQSRQSIPPEADDASLYAHEKAKERRADDYMRDREREAAAYHSYSPRRYSYDPREELRRQREYY